MELIKVNPTDFGLTDETAQNIKDQFLPMLNKMVELEEKFNEVVAMPIDDPNTSQLAKDLRNEYRSVRKATEDIHKKQKAFYLNGGRYVDGWKNAQLFASQGKEEELKRIENYLEEIEKTRLQELAQKRFDVIKPFLAIGEDVNLIGLSVMDDDIFLAYVEVKKKGYNERMEAERIANEQREKQERISQLNQQRSIELREYWMFMDEDVKIMNFGVMSDKYYEGLLVDLKRRKSEHDIEQQRLREENESMRKKQMEVELERKRLSDELEKKEKEFREAQRLQQLEEEKARKEAKKLAKAPLQKQLNVWVDNFELPELPITNNEVVLEICLKFNSFKAWSKSLIEKI